MIGQKEALIKLKYTMSDTPGGTKKKARFFNKKSDIPFTHLNFIQPNLSKRVSNNMPMMLEGSLIPVMNTMNSPIPRHPNIIKHCLITKHSFFRMQM